MPTYQYRCQTCHGEFEVRQSFTDDALTTCITDACTGPVNKVFSGVGISFKGDGFYKNDHGSVARGRSTEKSAADKSTSGSSDSGSDTGSAGDGSSPSDSSTSDSKSDSTSTSKDTTSNGSTSGSTSRSTSSTTPKASSPA